jgi:phosphatidylserine decarboxylase
VLLNPRYRGPSHIACPALFRKGEELGYFHHGSTIIVLGSGDMSLLVQEGATVRMGEPLLRGTEGNGVASARSTPGADTMDE